RDTPDETVGRGEREHGDPWGPLISILIKRILTSQGRAERGRRKSFPISRGNAPYPTRYPPLVSLPPDIGVRSGAGAIVLGFESGRLWFGRRLRETIGGSAEPTS